MRVKGILLFAACAVLIVAAYILFHSSLPGPNRSFPEIIWRQQKAGTSLVSILPSRACIGVLAYENEKYVMYCLDVTGQLLDRKEVGPENSFFLSAGASRDRPLFCLISKKRPLVVDMEKGRIYRPALEAGRHAIPRPDMMPPNTPALCPCGKNMLVHGRDKKNGKTRWKAWVVDSLSGKTVREIVDRPKGRDSFYCYVWNDDCTLTWLDPDTGLIRNERKGILSDACKDLIFNLPSGMCIKLSPDASTIAIYSRKVSGRLDIAFYDTATGKKRYEVQTTIRKSETIHGVYWSPDSSKLCVGFDGEDLLTGELYIIGQDKMIKKISLRGWQFFGYYGHVAWLQDSKHIVCLLYSHEGERQALALFDVD